MLNTEHDIEYCGVHKTKIMAANPVINLGALKHYLEYNKARSHVYYQKEICQNDAPWTEHPIIQNYKFTNVRREFDRESVWLINHVVCNTSLSLEEKILNCFLFRLINKGDAITSIFAGPVLFDVFDDAMCDIFIERQKNYDGALQSAAYFLSHVRKQANDKCPERMKYTNAALAWYVNHHRDTILDAYKASNPQSAYYGLTQIPAIGEFLGYQIWVDWTYMSEYRFSENEFVISGPGCNDGIDWMCSDRDGLNYEEFIFWFRDNLVRIAAEAGHDWNPELMFHYMPEHSRNWGVMAIENSFCELNKLMKLISGKPMRIRRYDGT